MSYSFRFPSRVFGVLTLATLLMASAAWAKYPERNIDLIIPWSAGGATDVATRLMVDYGAKELGQGIIVNNIPGGNGALGWAKAAQEKTDGYTIVCLTFDILANQAMGTTPVGLDNFDVILQFSTQPLGVFTHKDSPYHTLKELMDAAKANPGQVTMSTLAFGSSFHQGVGLLEMQVPGAKFKSIPNKSSAEIIAAIAGNHANAAVMALNNMNQHVESGNVRLLAVLNAERVKEFPDAPTAKELGYDVSWSSWRAIGVPKGVPADVKKVLDEAFKRAFDNPEFQAKAIKASIDLLYRTGDEFKKMAGEQYPLLVKTLKMLGVLK
ncbi:ABC transporter substrate-binding protein [Deltaproteobacteria bacterium]|nr:ABC transporter substrate-binding protein [Deltaproteobacteria bacterium]